MTSSSYDVVVIGAGLAGLAAARICAADGRAVVLLEARARIGGRTFTVERNGVDLDLGAEWVAPRHHTVVMRYLRDYGLETARAAVPDEPLWDVLGRCRKAATVLDDDEQADYLELCRVLDFEARRGE